MSAVTFDVPNAQGPKRYFGALAPEGLAHGYLFTGPSGIGKRTFARRLAQSLLCQGVKSGVLGYDGTCSSCRLFAQNAHHPDFIEHEGVLKIGDRDAPAGFHDGEDLSARDLVRHLSMQSYSGGMRVLLLADVDFATHHAANALLKFLEEPPRGVVMILTTAMPGRILPTIRSRLVEIRFSGPAFPMPADDGDEESLRAQVVRWFYESVEGKMPQDSWATRESVAEGIEMVKTLVRDWIVAGSCDGVPLVSGESAERLRALPPLTPREAVTLLGRLDEAARVARTNVAPRFVADLARMALTNVP